MHWAWEIEAKYIYSQETKCSFENKKYDLLFWSTEPVAQQRLRHKYRIFLFRFCQNATEGAKKIMFLVCQTH